MIVHLSFVVPFVAFVFCCLLTFLLSISVVVLFFFIFVYIFYLCLFLSLSSIVFIFSSSVLPHQTLVAFTQLVFVSRNNWSHGWILVNLRNNLPLLPLFMLGSNWTLGIAAVTDANLGSGRFRPLFPDELSQIGRERDRSCRCLS